ncbi:TPA: hypothetical protein ACH3X1_002704 [Trebouxia sp. C0004]
MHNLHKCKNLFPIVHDGQEYHGGVNGGIAPYGLSDLHAANQLSLAYKQSNGQKQRYREQHDDMAKVSYLPYTCLQHFACFAVGILPFCLTWPFAFLQGMCVTGSYLRTAKVDWC